MFNIGLIFKALETTVGRPATIEIVKFGATLLAERDKVNKEIEANNTYLRKLVKKYE